jgi:tol-pal system protein YbgF
VAAAVAVVAVLSAACGLVRGGTKPASGPQAPPDAVTALRQDLDRMRSELAELRAAVDAQRRAAAEHADRGVAEVRSEVEAVRQALEAAARHDAQRHVEVLDAQARRIDLLDRRAAELGQMLQRVQLVVGSLESQVGRLLDAAPPRSGAGAARPAPAPVPSTPSPGGGSPGLEPWPPPGAGQGGAEARAPAAAAGTAGARAAAAPPSGPPTPSPPVAKATPVEQPPPAERPPGAPTPTGGTPPARAPGAPVVAVTGARALYDRAMESWQKGELGQAVLDFEELVQTFPGDPLAASAQFWIGEAYFAARDFERAVVEYRKVLALAPRGQEAPRTLLRLGLAYRAQRREVDARQAWTTLVREFPSSDAAEEARRALRSR